MAPAQEKETPRDLFQAFWSWRMKTTPEFASLAGNSDYNDQLEDYSLERFGRDNQTCLDFIARAEKLLAEGEKGLCESEKLNLRLLLAELETFTSGYESEGYLYPLNFIEGVHIDFQRLSGWMALKNEEDYRNLIKRYEAFPKQAEGIERVLREGVRKGKTNHALSMKGVLEALKGHSKAKPPQDTDFFQPFQSLPDSFSPKAKAELASGAEKAIAECVVPGFAGLAKYLEEEYLPHTRPDIAATSLPDGKKFYEQCIKFHTSVDWSAEKIHQIGLAEVKKIEGDMKKIMSELGHQDMSLKDFMAKLRDDPQFYCNSEQEVLDTFKEMLEKKINPRLTKIFNRFPEHKLQVVPSEQENAPAAYYIGGTADGSRPGDFFANVKQFKSQPKYEMLTLALHEGNPGHHLQGSFSLSEKDMPDFRKVMEDRSYFQAPSRFPINTAYGEGWALYAEALGFDLGLYDDPYERFGHLSYKIFRACRLVVDTGLHALGWSRQRAVDYLLEHSASSEGQVQSEVDRYITWPGQALGYMIGQLKIAELRRRAETELTGAFDLKAFHDVVLRTCGPLNVLEEEVNKYIAEAKK